LIWIENTQVKIEHNYKKVEQILHANWDSGAVSIDDIHVAQGRLESWLKILESEMDKWVKVVEVRNSHILEKIGMVESE